MGCFGLVWFDALHPGKHFFSHVGMEPLLPGITSTFGGKYVLLKDRTRRPESGLNHRPLDPESEILNTRPPGPPMLVGCKTLIQQMISSFPKDGNSAT